MNDKKFLIIMILILIVLIVLSWLGQNNNKETENTYLYTEEELDIYEKYITENFGEIKEVLHEVVSPDIHLDIIVIAPTEEENYYKLITMGMGAYRMNIPSSLKNNELEYAELVLYLPPTWDITSDNEEDYWPIRALKDIARLPINNNTWVGYGHTISSDGTNTPYASNTKFCSMLLINALNRDSKELNLRIDGKGKINFYQLFPLYEEELNYKLENGTEELFKLFSNEDSFPIININRKNYCE